MKIKSLRLVNVRSFEDTQLNFINPNTNKPLSAVVLLGDNGAGKSTILKSIVHCLTVWNPVYGGQKFDEFDIRNGDDHLNVQMDIAFNPKEKEQLFDGVDKRLSTKLCRFSVGMVKRADGECANVIYGDFTSKTRDRYIENYHKFSDNFTSSSFDGGYIFYFDSFRYLPKIEVEGPNMLQLPTNMKENSIASSIINHERINDKFLHIKQWLVNLDFKRLKNPSPENEGIFAHIINAFNLLFAPYEFVKISDNGEILFKNENSIVEMDKLSDGFKNIFIIIGEIFYRLYSVDKDNIKFYQKEAIILIDEIDCHLHPKWQMNLIPSLKGMFPNCQIIATTHSPLILTNLSSDEIFKLGE